MTKRRLILLLVVLIGAMALVIASCGNGTTTTTSAGTATTATTATTVPSSSETTATTASETTSSSAATTSGAVDLATVKKLLNIPDGAAAAQGVTINLGASLPLSGGGAFYGEHDARGIKLAVQQIEAMGGPHFNVTYYDIQMGVAERGIDAVRKMASNNTHAALVAWCAASGAQIAPAQENKILMLDGGGGTSVLWQGQDYFWGTRAIPSIDQVKGTLTYIKQKMPNAKNVALLQQDYGTAMINPIADNAKKCIADLGMSYTGAVVVPVDATEFSDAIAKLKAMSPDVILCLTVDGPAPVAFMKQYQTSGMNAIVVGSDYTIDNAKLAGAAWEKNYWYAGEEFFADQPGSAWTQLFIDTYRKAYGSDPDFYGANYYEDTFAVWDLIRRVIASGGDPNDGEALQNALKANPTFMSVYGGSGDTVATYSLDPTSHSVASKTNYVFAVKNNLPDLLASFQGPSGSDLKIVK